MCKRINYFLPFVLISILITDLTAQVDPGTENLTHSWTFEDGTANDYIGGANGTLMGTAEVFEGAYVAIDPDCWMEMPADQIALNTYSEITIEAWFRSILDANTGYHMLVFFGTTVNNVGNDYYFMTPARGDDKSRAAISIGVESNPWTGESGADGPELDDGELHHMLSTLTPAEIALYIDGQMTDTTFLSENNFIEGINTTFAYLGKGGYVDDPTWLGQILEFNIYNKALSADEVLFLYEKGPSVTDVNDGKLDGFPTQFSLLQNYPNPFNPATTISYDIPKNAYVKINIYDMLGRFVTNLVNETQTAGRHITKWTASDLGSGNYLCRMEARNEDGSAAFTSVRKLLLLK